MNITSIRSLKNYIKTGALASLVSLASCTNKAPIKDTFEFADSTAAKLITRLENGKRHSIVIFTDDSSKRIIKADEINKFKTVPDTLLEKLKELPDTIQMYYEVYKGKGDTGIRKAKKLKDNLLTVGHGNIGEDSIKLAGENYVKEGDYISKIAADSLFQKAINEKDSILKANISENTYKNLKKNQRDAILSYLYNVNETLLIKHDKTREIPESFFECLNKAEFGKVQAKFNVSPSGKAASGGLAKRNLIQMIVFGDGEISKDKYAQKTFKELVLKIKKSKKKSSLAKEVIDICREYGVDEKKLGKTEEMIKKYI